MNTGNYRNLLSLKKFRQINYLVISLAKCYFHKFFPKKNVSKFPRFEISAFLCEKND